MTFSDPFFGYSFLVRTIVFVAVPLFLAWQVVRFRRALHVFQLEGYKRSRFARWCLANRRRALFMKAVGAKKPLVMTGRAWRLLVATTTVNAAVVLGSAAAAHLWLGGAPADLLTWLGATLVTFFFAPVLLLFADVMLAPVQRAVNARYLRSARRRLHTVAPVVIGVTGSFGKTSTKFAVARLLGDPDEVLATPASFNTPLGVCRTINESLRPGHKFFVVEMGAYGEGEIAELCRFVAPRIGVLTAIGPAHLERFGSMEAIERGKYELIASLPPDGVAVMNVDDPRIRRLADETRHVRVVRYGVDPEGSPEVKAEEVRVTSEGTEFVVIDSRTGARSRLRTQLLGRFAVLQVLAAVATGLALGRSLDDLAAPVADLQPVEHRLQLIRGQGGVVVIDDAFNSNPEGARAALEVLAAMPASRRIVVTPGIVELGDVQAAENEQFAARAADIADVLIAVAPLNRDALVRGASGGGSRCEVIAVDSLEAATDQLRKLLRAGDVVLFENDLPDQYES